MSKINKNIYIYVLFFVVMALFGLKMYYSIDYRDVLIDRDRSKDSKYMKEQSDLFNNIVKDRKTYDDYKKCDVVEVPEYRDLCASQIKFNFDNMNTATSDSDCEKLKDTKEMKKEQRRDVCYLNLNYRLATSSEGKKWCEKITNIDYKNLCISQNDLKFKNKK